MLASLALNLVRLAQSGSGADRDYDYDYDYSNTLSPEEAGAVGLMFGLIFLVIILPLVVLMIVSMWKVFEKAGKPGWAAIVPFYNGYVLAEVGGKPGWWGLVSIGGIIPFIGIPIAIVAFVLNILISIGITKNFGKDDAFALLLILVPFVGYPILGFGKAHYKPVAGGGSAPTAATAA